MRNVIAHLILVQSEFVNFDFYDFFFGIFPINVMFASLSILKTSTKLALITKL